MQVSLLSPELFALTWLAESRQDGRSRAGRVNFRFRPMAVFVRRVGLSRKRTFRAVLRRRERAHARRSVDHRLCSEADVQMREWAKWVESGCGAVALG